MADPTEFTTRQAIIDAIKQLQSQPVTPLPGMSPEQASRQRQLAVLSQLSGDKPLTTVGAQIFKDVEGDQARQERLAQARDLANLQRQQGMLGILSSEDTRREAIEQRREAAQARAEAAEQARRDRLTLAGMVDRSKPMQIVEGPGGERYWADPRTQQIVGPVMVGGQPLPAKTRNLPESAMKRLEDFGGQAEQVGNFARTFKPEYGSSAPIPGLGRLEMQLGQLTGTEAGNWWQNYNKWVNTIRHSEFGSALTPVEVRSFEAANVTPNMPGHVIKDNLRQQEDILKRAYNRILSTHGRANYDVSRFEPLTLEPVPAPGEAAGLYRASGVIRRATDALSGPNAPSAPGVPGLTPQEQRELDERKRRAAQQRGGG